MKLDIGVLSLSVFGPIIFPRVSHLRHSYLNFLLFTDSNATLEVDLVCSVGNLSKVCKLFGQFDLVDSFSPTGNITAVTVFVPTNEAFEVLEGNDDFDFDVMTTEQSIYVLLYHVIALEGTNSFSYSDLECGKLLKTSNGDSVRTKCDGALKFQKGPKQMDDRLAKIILPNVNVCNGVVHVVNNVMLPNLGKIA